MYIYMKLCCQRALNAKMRRVNGRWPVVKRTRERTFLAAVINIEVPMGLYVRAVFVETA